MESRGCCTLQGSARYCVVYVWCSVAVVAAGRLGRDQSGSRKSWDEAKGARRLCGGRPDAYAYAYASAQVRQADARAVYRVWVGAGGGPSIEDGRAVPAF